MIRKHIEPGTRLPVKLSTRERDLVVERAFLDPAIEADLRRPVPTGSKVLVNLNHTKVHRVPPSEADLQRCFKVSAPAVHAMILTLERLSLIERTAERPGPFECESRRLNCRSWRDAGTGAV